VAPIFVDSDSDIKHPEKDALLALVREFNSKNEKELVAKIKDTGAYFSVRYLEAAAPDDLYRTLLSRSERRDDAGVVYTKQFFKPEEIKSLVTQNSVDAVLLVVVSGLTRHDRKYASNLLTYLDADYNLLVMTAQVVDANGTTLWEYPNFRVGGPSTPVFVDLQYADFDQAAANLDDKVEVKFKTIPGISRYLGEKASDLLFREKKVSKAYNDHFDKMVDILKPPTKFFATEDKKQSKAVYPEQKPAAQPAVQQSAQPASTPAATMPSPAAAPQPAVQSEGLAVPAPEPIKEVPISK